jgi:1-acyl-sn-glycerol-3-phosphate acyltransferase
VADRLTTSLGTRALRLARMALHIAQGLATLIFLFPRVSPTRRQRLIRSWDGKVLKIFAMRMQVDAPPGFDLAHTKRLYVGNHISWIDVYALQSITGARFVAKSELAAWPVLGTLIAKSGTIFIERAKRADTRRIVKTVQQHLTDGDIIAVFPEGSTTDGRDVHKFHGNLLQSAIDADAEIVPFCLRYTDAKGHFTTAAAYVGEMSLWESLKLMLREKKMHCELTLFAPLEVAGRDRRQLAHAAESLVRQRLQGYTRQDR